MTEGAQGGSVESLNGFLHSGPGRVAFTGQANSFAATIVLVLNAFDPTAPFQPVEDGCEVLPADIKKFDQVLDGHSIVADEGTRECTQNGPLLCRGPELADVAGALFVHQVRRLIEAEKYPVGDVEFDAGFCRYRSQYHCL